MKSSARRFLLMCPLWFVPLLSGCNEMEGQINTMKDRIASGREANQLAAVELQELNQKLSLIKRQINADAVKRNEFEAKAKKSGTTESLLIQYRSDLEKSLTEFSTAVTAYREKYAAP